MCLRLAISMGDFNGIGPEIILKSLDQIADAGATPIIMGHQNIFAHYADVLNLEMPDFKSINRADEIAMGRVNFLNFENAATITPQAGQYSVQAGALAMQAVEKGMEWCQKNYADGLVTAPISKEAINEAGYHYPGHTEFLAEKTHTGNFLMMLVYDELRVGLVTIHIPLREVAEKVTQEKIFRNTKIMHTALKNDFSIPNPYIAVLGLNPHAGDGGVIGEEEINIITPALEQAATNNINVEGPFPADGFFGNKKYHKYDGILAMYHDQGLVPFKTLSFGRGVNVTAGLPIVRTSPDHGTAFDIAGKNLANPSSFVEASKLAIKLSANRLKATTHHV